MKKMHQNSRNGPGPGLTEVRGASHSRRNERRIGFAIGLIHDREGSRLVILRLGRGWMHFDRGTVVLLAHQPIAPHEEDLTLSARSTAHISVRRLRCRAGRPASQRGNLAQHRRPRASISSSTMTLHAPQPLPLHLRRPCAPHPPTVAR
jgi:hypothetical protein